MYSKRKRLNIKIDRGNKALVNEKIRLKKEITKLTTATDSTKSTPRKTKKKGEKKAHVKSQKSTQSIQPQNVAIPEGFREVKSKKNKKRRTTKQNPVHIQKNNTPAENRNITPDQPNKRNSPVVKITKTTVITDSLGAGLGERLRGKNTCVYVKRGATVDRIHNDIVHNKGYLDSNRLMLLCGTNNISQKTSLGQTILASDKLIDTAVSLNPTADIHMVALPYRWDNPDLNDKIDTYNAFLKYKADKIPQVKIVDTSSFQQGRNAYYMKDKLHLNNQGTNLLARTVTEAVNFHNRKFRAER